MIGMRAAGVGRRVAPLWVNEPDEQAIVVRQRLVGVDNAP